MSHSSPAPLVNLPQLFPLLTEIQLAVSIQLITLFLYVSRNKLVLCSVSSLSWIQMKNQNETLDSITT